MKIILTQDVDSLGKAGEIKNVANGYAQNFLLPKKMAKLATPDEVRKIEKEMEKRTEKEKEELEKMQKVAEKMDGQEVVIRKKAKDGKLFGSIKNKEIVGELKKLGFEIDEKSIIIKDPIKELGERDVLVKLSHGLEVSIKVVIEEE